MKLPFILDRTANFSKVLIVGHEQGEVCLAIDICTFEPNLGVPPVSVQAENQLLRIR
jgi:hypothetical protein